MRLLAATFAILLISSPTQARHVCSNPNLRVDVYHHPQARVTYQNTSLLYSPTTFTLVSSAHEAVLIDTPARTADAEKLADWIADTVPGKKLKYVYITHAHLDHFGGFEAVVKKWPDAQVVATSGVKAHMPAQYAEPLWTAFWKGLFPDVNKADLLRVRALKPGASFFLEDGRYEFRPMEVGGGDTVDSTVLYVPHIDLVVGGDVVYGKCFQYLAENPSEGDRKAWVKSLREIALLQPKWVVPSHMQEDEDFGIEHLEQTEKYIKTWDRWLGKVKSWEELETMTKREWTGRVGTFILRYTAQSFFNATF